MDLRYKLNRIHRWGSAFGYLEALRFEFMWSCKRSLVSVRVPGYGQPLWLRRDFSDLSVFETVFLNREFDACVPGNPQLIIDGGAYVGYSTAFFANAFPGAMVVAIEPSAANVALLRVNCRGLLNVNVVEAGLWPFACRLHIANPHDDAWSFQCEPAPDGAVGAFPARAIEELIEESGHQRCDLLKLDVEGTEEQLFSNAERWLSLVDAILVEIHGPRARHAVDSACPPSEWTKTDSGEKLLLVSLAHTLETSFPRQPDAQPSVPVRGGEAFWKRRRDAS